MSRKYLILSPPRTASTSLRFYLDTRETILCHGEILGRYRVLGVSNKISASVGIYERRMHPDRWLGKMFPGEFEYEGFKALNSHLLITENFHILKRFFAENPRCFILWRNDLAAIIKSGFLRRYASGHVDMHYIRTVSVNFILIHIDQLITEFRLGFNYWIADKADFTTITIDQVGEVFDFFEIDRSEGMEMPHISTGENVRTREEIDEATNILNDTFAASEVDAFRNISAHDIM